MEKDRVCIVNPTRSDKEKHHRNIKSGQEFRNHPRIYVKLFLGK